MSITRELAERLDALETTEDDVRRVRTLLLDHLAVVANGAKTDSARAAQQLAAMMETTSGVSFPIIGTSMHAPVPYAMIANGTAGHSIEFDDTHSTPSSHPGVAVFPAALGAATMADVEAAEMLRGVILGYEAMCRLGRAADPPGQYAAHFHPTATTGTIGAAVASASIFGLNVDETVSAIVDAQFSLPFAIAVALSSGKAGLTEYTMANLTSPPVLDIMDRVSYRVDPAVDAAYPQHWGASVRVETVDGRLFEKRVIDPKGDPHNPFTELDLEAKFHDLTRSTYDDSHRKALIDVVRGLGTSATLDELVALLPSDATA